jgi:hypothetical protein
VLQATSSGIEITIGGNPMSKTMSAKEIGEAWLTYVNDMFMTENGCNRQYVVEELQRLDTSGILMQAREDGRVSTDELIDMILLTPAESRDELFCQFNSRPLALVNDRIQCGTQLLAGFVQQGQQINIDGVESLEDFFRQILQQKPVEKPEAEPETEPEAEPEAEQTT